MPDIGVLAFQGDFRRHIEMLRSLGVSAREVRTAGDLESAEGIILPGGESTTIGKLLKSFDVHEPLRRKIRGGLPTFGTCAGLILLARHVEMRNQHRLDVLDVDVQRNAYGRQVESFEVDIPVPSLGPDPVRGVFIRAPVVTRVGDGIEVLASFEGAPVLLRKDWILAASFHPELTADTRLHRYFLSMVEDAGAGCGR
jgi:5'-phosphate synthase pdxT subunit